MVVAYAVEGACVPSAWLGRPPRKVGIRGFRGLGVWGLGIGAWGFRVQGYIIGQTVQQGIVHLKN